MLSAIACIACVLGYGAARCCRRYASIRVTRQAVTCVAVNLLRHSKPSHFESRKDTLGWTVDFSSHRCLVSKCLPSAPDPAPTAHSNRRPCPSCLSEDHPPNQATLPTPLSPQMLSISLSDVVDLTLYVSTDLPTQLPNLSPSLRPCFLPSSLRRTQRRRRRLTQRRRLTRRRRRT